MSPVGRLDLDSEGLLVLTDDGQTLHRLAHPQFSHAKTYFVLVLGRPDAEALRSLRQGMQIKLGYNALLMSKSSPLRHLSLSLPCRSPHRIGPRGCGWCFRKG